MPVYEMKCQNPECGLEFEEFYKLDEKASAVCPICGSHAEVEFRSNPGHFRHVSWSKWRIGHAD